MREEEEKEEKRERVRGSRNGSQCLPVIGASDELLPIKRMPAAIIDHRYVTLTYMYSSY